MSWNPESSSIGASKCNTPCKQCWIFFFIKLALFTQNASHAILTCKSVSVHTVVQLSYGYFYFGMVPNAYLIVIESYFNKKIIYFKRAALLKGRHSLLESIKQIWIIFDQMMGHVALVQISSRVASHQV